MLEWYHAVGLVLFLIPTMIVASGYLYGVFEERFIEESQP